jgi:hypothetical protein
MVLLDLSEGGFVRGAGEVTEESIRALAKDYKEGKLALEAPKKA